MTVFKLYSMPVERADGKRQGYVLAVLREGGQISALMCADGGERVFFVRPADIVKTSGTLIYGAECAARAGKNILRLNTPAYTAESKFLGYVEDYTLKAYAIKNCIIGGKAYPFERVSLGDIAIVNAQNRAGAALAAKDLFLQAIVGGQ